ncbi:acetoacetate decarboxylase [Streptomyces polyrhachis]|uniref:Acetoacetate decarboxylase n=1 Tax=Streptomyces polyrhachis TaxID=1282885 RepID=A0ABW2GJG3_9ACTN
MKAEDVVAEWTTPLGAPAFPKTRYKFVDREYFNIVYRTDPEALRRFVPEPLTIPEPLVRFEVMRMPDVTGLGDYTECGQLAVVELDGVRGEYNMAMYVDDFAAIASGRELGAYPKKLGSPRLALETDTLTGTLDYGSVRVATATMGYKYYPLAVDKAREEIAVPTYMLKKLPGFDGQPRICELVRAEITDVEIKGAWTGPARLQLFEHVMAPLADLPVREIVSVSHLLTDLTLGSPGVVHDYL